MGSTLCCIAQHDEMNHVSVSESTALMNLLAPCTACRAEIATAGYLQVLTSAKQLSAFCGTGAPSLQPIDSRPCRLVVLFAS
jgi:hypothetical protein